MNYSLSQKPKRPGHPEDGKVWIATPQRIRTLTTEDLVKKISSENSFSRAQLTADFVLITGMIRRLLREGYNINIKGLGTFYSKFECEPLESETANGYTPSKQIKKVKAGWKPSEEMASLEPILAQGERKMVFKHVPSLKANAAMEEATKTAQTTVDIS